MWSGINRIVWEWTYDHSNDIARTKGMRNSVFDSRCGLPSICQPRLRPNKRRRNSLGGGTFEGSLLPPFRKQGGTLQGPAGGSPTQMRRADGQRRIAGIIETG